MKRIGIKFYDGLDYELFEPLQYWLDYDFEYEAFLEDIEKDEVIALELEEDEDRVEDIEMLQAFLMKLGAKEIKYSLFEMNGDWKKVALEKIV